MWTGFSAYLESQKRWYRLFGRKRAIRRHSEDKLEVFAMNVFNAGATDGANDNVTLNSDTARERMLAQRAGLLEKIKSYSRLGAPTGGELGDVAGAHLFRQYLRDGNVTRDMDLFQSLDERLWEQSDLLRASAREARREQAQNALRARNAAERTALLLAPHAAGKSVAAGEWSEAQRQQMAAEVQAVAR